jgi:hypothetical protein
MAYGDSIHTTKDCEVGLGKYNQSNSDTIFSIGNGTSGENNHKNAFEITN